MPLGIGTGQDLGELRELYGPLEDYYRQQRRDLDAFNASLPSCGPDGIIREQQVSFDATGARIFGPLNVLGGGCPNALCGPEFAAAEAACKGAQPMGFFDDLTSTIGNVLNTVTMNAPAIGQLVQTVQQIINPATGSPMVMPAMAALAPMMMGAGDGLDAFRAACAAQPGCQDRLARELAMMNATTGSFDVTQAGVGSALANPAVINILRGLGLGALVGAGGELVSGAAGAVSNLLSSSPRPGAGPIVMNWPAGVPYPRGIVFRAPDRPEKRYRTQGAALLNSGDIAASKRVRKAAGRARRGTRRSSPRNITPVISAHSVCGKCLTSPCVGGHS